MYALLRDHPTVLPQLVSCLQSGKASFSADVLCLAVDALSQLLACNELASNLFRLPGLLDGAGGLDLLEDLQTHPSEALYAKAARLLERFFPGGGSDDADEAGSVEDGGGAVGAGDGGWSGGAAFALSGGGGVAWSSEDLADLTATLADLRDTEPCGETSSVLGGAGGTGAELESG